MKKFEGLIAAPFAPMSANGEVMYDRIEGYYDFLEKNGVVGALSMAPPEREFHSPRKRR